MTTTQIPPADELAQVRANLKALEAREAELKALLISDPSSRTGNQYLAEIREVETQRTDLVEMRKMYPIEVAEHTHRSRITRVMLSTVDGDTGEIVRVHRAPKLHTIRVV